MHEVRKDRGSAVTFSSAIRWNRTNAQPFFDIRHYPRMTEFCR
jgi:hypothetical protein